jgi:hypothetical protein
MWMLLVTTAEAKNLPKFIPLTGGVTKSGLNNDTTRSGVRVRAKDGSILLLAKS